MNIEESGPRQNPSGNTSESGSGGSPARTGRWRWRIAVLAVIIGSLLLPFATVAMWLHDVVLNTDQYIEIVGPLVSNEAVADLLAERITTQLFEKVDVEDAVRNRLPDRAQFLAAPLTANLQAFARTKIDDLISSERFQDVWIRANKALHIQMVKLLRNEGEVLQLNDGQVTLELSAVLVEARARLDAAGIDIFDGTRLEDVDTSIVLFESKGLEKLQVFVAWLDRLAVWLPILALISYGSALVISSRRQSTLLSVGVGIALSMAILGLALYLGRRWFVNSETHGNLTPETAGVMFDAICRDLVLATTGLFVLGLGVVLFAFLWRRPTGIQ